MSTPKSLAPVLFAFNPRALAMAILHRNVSLKVGYSMPRYAADARRHMRTYALQARGKSPAA